MLKCISFPLVQYNFRHSPIVFFVHQRLIRWLSYKNNGLPGMNHLHNLHFWLIMKYKVLNIKWQSGAYNINGIYTLEHNIEGVPPELQERHETKLLNFEGQLGRGCFLAEYSLQSFFFFFVRKASFLLSLVILLVSKTICTALISI